jgi:hypothetical protein
MLRHANLFVLASLVLIVGAAPASADTCDLTSTGSSCGPSQFGGALFQQYTPTATTTYTVDPFLRLFNSGIEQGYNTSATTFDLNQQDTLNATDSILLEDVPIVMIDGVAYREFYLDINEPNSASKRLLSLDELRIYLSDTGGLTGYDATSQKLGGLTAIYDLDSGLTAGQDNWIQLNYSLNSGGSSGDMVAYIPNSLFTGSSEQYVYLYSKFGVKGGSLAADGSAETGFEEWWLKRPAAQASLSVPEPGMLLLFGTGLSLALRRVRRCPRKRLI